MKVLAADFVCYFVKDIQKSLEFYRDILGLTVSDQFGKDFYEFNLGNVTLGIGSAEAMGETIDKPQGNATVGLAVEDVAATVKELKEKGIEVNEDVQDFPGCQMVSIKDPSGNSIMLHHRKDGTVG